MNRGKPKAEEAFAMFNRQQEKKARKEKKKARQEMAEHVARLRGLRLAKEAADKEAEKNKKPSQLP